MKYTLLEIVSDILSDMDSDFVDSINDTDEATQVAQIVKTTYQAMMSNRNWPHTARLIHLTPFTDNTLPTHMRVEEEYKELISVFYDCRKTLTGRLDFRQMKYLEPDAFLRYINQRNSTDPNTLTISDPSGIILLITSNKAPEYFTSFDDTNIVFDSYDSVMDTTLQGSKTQARAYTIPEFEMVDSFIPDLPDEAFSALIEEAKSKAMFKLKQTQDIKAEQEANRQQRWLSRKAWRVHEQDIYPFNYGRNTRGGSYRKDPTFRREN
jgi:hypothetical protein